MAESKKIKLTKFKVVHDGVYSHMVLCHKTAYGAQTFSECKKEILKDLKSRMNEYRWAVKEMKSVDKAEAVKRWA